MDLENFPTSQTGKEMLGYVSEEFYARSYVAKWLFQVMGLEWDDVWALVEAMPEQAFPETATWGMMYHELKYGLPIRESLSHNERLRRILQRRDVKKPMNPWGIEQIIYSMTGMNASVRDSNDDPGIPANTFVLEIESGNEDLDLSAVFAKIREVKQSHVAFELRVCTGIGLAVVTSEAAWLCVYTLCGTIPDTSRGLDLNRINVTLETSRDSIRNYFPMTGNSGSTGRYPKESRIADLNGSGTGISISTKLFGSAVKICGSQLDL